MKIGILGCSSVFENSIIKPGLVEVRSIASRDIQKAERSAQLFHIPTIYSSYEELLHSAEIDTVYIALPPALQPKWVKMALEEGKNVLVEKPIATKYDALKELDEEIQKSPYIVLEGVMTQFHEWPRFVADIVKAEKYGALKRISTVINMVMPDEKLGFRKVKDLGGGVFLDQSSYWLQFIQSLVGLDFKEYGMNVNEYRYGVDWDVCCKGKIGSTYIQFEASYNKKYEVSHELIFERATLKIKNFFRAAMGNFKITVEICENDRVSKQVFQPQNYYYNQLNTFIAMDKAMSLNYWEKTKERIYWIEKFGKCR